MQNKTQKIISSFLFTLLVITQFSSIAHAANPSVTTNSAASINTSEVTIGGAINNSNLIPITEYWFEIGTANNNLSIKTPTVKSTNAKINPSQKINNLKENSTYYYRLAAKIGGKSYYGATLSFKTTSNAVFPLPGNGPHRISVLSKYSWGAEHGSYISQYVLKKGANAYPHILMDIPADAGTQVLAVADGKIKENNNHSGGGYNVVITHNDGTYSYYGHLQSQSTKKVGTTVKAGDVIGYVGSSGSSTGNHLHFEWSGHDPYCEFVAMGYNLKIDNPSGASKYHHNHGTPSSSTTTTTTTTTVPVLTNKGVSNITTTSVRLDGSCQYTGTRPSEVGVLIGTSSSNMKKIGSDAINHNKNPFDMWYTINALNPGTTYYYAFYAKVNGVDTVSSTKTFSTLPSRTTQAPITHNPPVTPPTTTKASGSTLTLTNKGASNITTSGVRLDGSCQYIGTRPSEVGVFIGTSSSNMQKFDSDAINHNKNPFDMWYTSNSLKPSTTYYYRFYAMVNGQMTYSDTKSFTTKSQHISATLTYKGVSNITRTSARLDGSCNYAGTKPSEVGIFIGTSTGNMKKFDSDAINHNKNPFDMWYTVASLKAGTTYYYRFYAVVNGQTIFGDIKSFTTAR